jgi:hypothetical protein
MHDPDPLGDVAGQRTGVDHVDQVHRDIALESPE